MVLWTDDLTFTTFTTPTYYNIDHVPNKLRKWKQMSLPETSL